MKYRQRRNAAALSRAFVAHMIGLLYSDYLKVEEGTKALSGERLEKYMEVTARKNKGANKLAQTTLFMEAHRKFEDKPLKQWMKEFNVTNQEVAEYLGLNKQSVSRMKCTNEISDNTALALYYYFNDDLNKNYGGGHVIRTSRKNFVPFKEQDIIELAGTKNIKDLTDMMGVGYSSWFQFRKTGRISPDYIENLKQSLRNRQNGITVDNAQEETRIELGPNDVVLPEEAILGELDDQEFVQVPVESSLETVSEDKDAIIKRLSNELIEAHKLIKRYEFLIDSAIEKGGI